jgi:hypothetical protein
MNILTAYPKLVTFEIGFGIGLAITFGIGLAFGTIDHNHAFVLPSYGCGEGVGI